MGFPRKDYCSGLPFPSPGDLPDPGIEPVCLVSPAWAGGFFNAAPPRKPQYMLLAQNVATPWTVAHQAPLSMDFSRQEYWNGLPFPSPGDLLDPGIKPGSPALQEDSLPSEPPGKPSKY